MLRFLIFLPAIKAHGRLGSRGQWKICARVLCTNSPLAILTVVSDRLDDFRLIPEVVQTATEMSIEPVATVVPEFPEIYKELMKMLSLCCQKKTVSQSCCLPSFVAKETG